MSNRLAVAILTAGPGITNDVTGLGAAYLDRAPVLIVSTRAPLLQDGMRALEEVEPARRRPSALPRCPRGPRSAPRAASPRPGDLGGDRRRRTARACLL
ncbi:MAG: thiamine pyrophosphate-binding protein [Solirubrobacterales bacterium]